MRLDKYLVSVTDLSRSEARQAIRRGDVLVDQQVVSSPAEHIDTSADVRLAGQSLRTPGHRYFMLHKPTGVVCANRDRLHQTVFDLLDEDNHERLHIAGRLDIDTTGLVLITDNGDWSHRITSPRGKCRKTYRVQLRDPLAPELIFRFERGIFLDDEKRRTRPAELHIVDDFQARLTIVEGRYHQVKRMFAAVGNAVLGLHREQIGSLILDSLLAPGEYRALTDEEVAAFE